MTEQDKIFNGPKLTQRYRKTVGEANRQSRPSSKKSNNYRLSVDQALQMKRIFSCDKMGGIYSQCHLSMSAQGSHALESMRMKKLKKKTMNGSDESNSLHNNEIDSEKETIKVNNDQLSRYETIANLTQQQNDNLKHQNQYLLETLRKMKQREEKVKKLYSKAQNYKSKWIQTKMQIDVMKEETHLYRSWLHDYKEISMIDIPILKQKVDETHEQAVSIDNESECNVQSSLFPKKTQQFFTRSYQSIEQQGSDEDQKTFNTIHYSKYEEQK